MQGKNYTMVNLWVTGGPQKRSFLGYLRPNPASRDWDVN